MSWVLIEMENEAKIYCMGLLKGLYLFAHESKSEFKDWSVDIPGMCFEEELNKWKKRNQNDTYLAEMSSFLKKECSKWQ